MRRIAEPAGYLLFLGIGLVLAVETGVQASPLEDWLQWGGPNRDFKTNSKGLAASWPKEGPRRLWSRPLGEGYSSIIVEGNTLYTMYREGQREIVIALEARTGKTVWTFAYDAPTDSYGSSKGKIKIDKGPGPHATPLLLGNRIFAVGSTTKFHCLNKKDGRLLWAHDLDKEFHATFRLRGYTQSPLAYKNMVILPVGGKGQALMAFRQSDGEVVWKGGDFDNSYSSPILIKVDGQVQIAALLAEDIVGFDPQTGSVLWSHHHPTTSESGLQVATPVWTKDNTLFVSSAEDGGSRAIKLKRDGNATKVEGLWFNKQMRVHFSTLMCVGDYIVGSSGDFGPAFFTAVNRHTGTIVWRDRSFAKASFLYVEGKLLLLDEDGNLALVTVSPEGLQIHQRAQVFESLSWTVPTLIGTKLYLRNKSTIMALDLGKVAHANTP